MTKGRLEAFSDGVIAILITIMVIELHAPHGADLAALGPVVPVLLSFLLSFVFLAIYWNNHHHLPHAVKRINGRGGARPRRPRGLLRDLRPRRGDVARSGPPDRAGARGRLRGMIRPLLDFMG